MVLRAPICRIIAAQSRGCPVKGIQINSFAAKVEFCRHLAEWSLNHLWRLQFARHSTFQISNWQSVDWSFQRIVYFVYRLHSDRANRKTWKNTIRFWCEIDRCINRLTHLLLQALPLSLPSPLLRLLRRLVIDKRPLFRVYQWFRPNFFC